MAETGTPEASTEYSPWLASPNAFLASSTVSSAPRAVPSQLMEDHLKWLKKAFTADQIVTMVETPIDDMASWLRRGSADLVFPTHATGPDPAESSYHWRDRLSMLHSWRGDRAKGEAERLSRQALQWAESLADHVERRSAASGVRLQTVIAPLREGGVHVEWTVRGSSKWLHLQAETPADDDDQATDARKPTALRPFSMLFTTETPEGNIEISEEIGEAVTIELLARIEKLVSYSRRLGRDAGYRRRNAS